MDFENTWTNCREETPPITAWRDKAQYSPLYYSSIKTTGSPYSNAENDPLYIPRNDIPSYSNVEYCTSPKYSNIANYTPEMCMPNELNGNIRYASYHPHMAPVRYRESLGHNCHLLCNDPRIKVDTDANSYYCQRNQHQHMRMFPQAYMCSYESNMYQMKQNAKKKRKQRNEPKIKIADTLNSFSNTNKMSNFIKSENETNSLLTTHENISNYLNHHQNSPSIVSKSTTEMNIFSNESNTGNTQTYLQPMKDDICESQRDFQSKFNLSYATNDASFKMSEVSSTISNQQINLRTTDDETEVNISKTDINCSENDTTNREIKDTHANNLDLSDPPVEEIPQEESMYQILNIEGSTLENSNMNIENIIFQPIFEGKDENGEDTIVLLVTPANEQGVSQENIFDTSINGEGIKIMNYQDINTNSIEITNFSDQNNLEIDVPPEHQTTNEANENLEENQSQIATNEDPQNNVHIQSQQNESVIISNVNDFFLEEVVDASESNCPNTKRIKKHTIELVKNIAVKKNRYKRKKCAEDSFLDNINTAKSTQFQLSLTSSKKFSDNITIPEPLPRNRKKFNMKFKAKKLKWKRHFQWKSNTQLNSLNNMYFSQIMKRLRHKYKGIRHNVAWIIMKIILDKIGGSVLQSIYNTIQLLAKIHVQKTSKDKTINSIFKKK